MDTILYQKSPIDQNWGEYIDAAVQMKEDARHKMAMARMALLNSGAKTTINGQLIHLPGLDVAKYERCANQEFAWEAIYKDGTIVKQFEDNGEDHHYGHIDQSRLKTIQWVSNFEDETDNKDRRVILGFDFEAGTFTLLNGFVLPEVRNLFAKGYPALLHPKLILKMVKRQSTTADQEGNIAETVTYYRYILGFEGSEQSTNKEKFILCAEPNGYIHVWHGK